MKLNILPPRPVKAYLFHPDASFNAVFQRRRGDSQSRSIEKNYEEARDEKNFAKESRQCRGRANAASELVVREAESECLTRLRFRSHQILPAGRLEDAFFNA